MRTTKTLTRLRERAGRLSFCWPNMSKGTFSHVAAQLQNIALLQLLTFLGVVSSLSRNSAPFFHFIGLFGRI